MAKPKATKPNTTRKSMRPALTPEARENQLISLATDLAEKQLREGTASSQVVTHFLKLATIKAELEKEKLIEENKLLRAKTVPIESMMRSEELMYAAIKAFRSYSGQADSDEY